VHQQPFTSLADGGSLLHCVICWWQMISCVGLVENLRSVTCWHTCTLLHKETAPHYLHAFLSPAFAHLPLPRAIHSFLYTHCLTSICRMSCTPPALPPAHTHRG
jgi:hypothetical protein